MKRRREPMEFPLLEVLAFPADHCPVSIQMPAEFELTGEVNYSMGVTTQQLEYIKKLLELVTNDIADELFSRGKKSDPPFKVTGGSSQEEASTE